MRELGHSTQGFDGSLVSIVTRLGVDDPGF